MEAMRVPSGLSLALGLDYFGLGQLPDSEHVVATLAGGWRDWEGLEVIFRKRLMNSWGPPRRFYLGARASF